jgi:hypothetical protein
VVVVPPDLPLCLIDLLLRYRTARPMVYSIKKIMPIVERRKGWNE